MRGCRSFGIATVSWALNGNPAGRLVERCGSFWPRWCSWGCSWGGASARRWRGCFRPSWGRSRTRGGSRAWFTGPAPTGRQGRATVPCAGRSPGLARIPPPFFSPPVRRSQGRLAARGPGRRRRGMGRRGRCCRKRWAVSAGGRSLYEIDRGLREPPRFFGLPPGPAFHGSRGRSRVGGSLCAAAVFFYVPLFQGASR